MTTNELKNEERYPSDLSNTPEKPLQKYGQGLSSSRVIELATEEEEQEFSRKLAAHVISNGGYMDDTDESWLDSEFNRIYVTYAYPDVTKVH